MIKQSPQAAMHRSSLWWGHRVSYNTRERDVHAPLTYTIIDSGSGTSINLSDGSISLCATERTLKYKSQINLNNDHVFGEVTTA